MTKFTLTRLSHVFLFNFPSKAKTFAVGTTLAILNFASDVCARVPSHTSATGGTQAEDKRDLLLLEILGISAGATAVAAAVTIGAYYCIRNACRRAAATQPSVELENPRNERLLSANSSFV